MEKQEATTLFKYRMKNGKLSIKRNNGRWVPYDVFCRFASGFILYWLFKDMLRATFGKFNTKIKIFWIDEDVNQTGEVTPQQLQHKVETYVNNLASQLN